MVVDPWLPTTVRRSSSGSLVVASVAGPPPASRAASPAAISPVGAYGGGHGRVANHLAGPARAASAGHGPASGHTRPRRGSIVTDELMVRLPLVDGTTKWRSGGEDPRRPAERAR